MRLIVVGDSVPAGRNCSEPPWPARLTDHVAALEPTDVTVDASTARTLANCVEPLDSALARSDAPTVALVQAGHNDAQLSGGSPRVSKSEFARTAARIDDQLTATDRLHVGAVVGLIPLLPGYSVPFSDDQPERGLEYDRALAEGVRTHLPVIGDDGPTTLGDWSGLTADGVHPTAAGHERIANAVAPWLRSVL